MSRAGRTRPGHWPAAVAIGLYRSAVLVVLTAAVPAVAVAVGSLFTWATLSFHWAGRDAPAILHVLATVGEVALAIWWTVLVVAVMLAFASRPLAEAARRCSRKWLGARIEPSYRPAPSLTLMASGYWWNGDEYHRSKREARRRAWLSSRRDDPQARRDWMWTLVAVLTVLPAAALPLATLAVGAGTVSGPVPTWLAILLVVGGLVVAPFTWRILGVVAPRFLGSPPRSRLDDRLEELESIRADLTQSQAAELERIERGLHDGAQARIVALAMSLGEVERLFVDDPAAARKILAEARASSMVALNELRALVRGVNPPVLAERGLVDALRALALDAPIRVTVAADLPSRPERPIEAAIYFAVAELLTNVAKHAGATRATVRLEQRARMLTATVTDDGAGGAIPSDGSGLDGIRRRVVAFGGRMEIDSPAGGPTCVTVAVPCELS